MIVLSLTHHQLRLYRIACTCCIPTFICSLADCRHCIGSTYWILNSSAFTHCRHSLRCTASTYWSRIYPSHSSTDFQLFYRLIGTFDISHSHFFPVSSLVRPCVIWNSLHREPPKKTKRNRIPPKMTKSPSLRPSDFFIRPRWYGAFNSFNSKVLWRSLTVISSRRTLTSHLWAAYG